MSIEIHFSEEGEEPKSIASIPEDEIGVFIDYDPDGKRAIVTTETDYFLGGANVYVFNDPDLVELAEGEDGIPHEHFTNETLAKYLLPGSFYDCAIHASSELYGRLVFRHVMDSAFVAPHMAN